MSESFDFYEAFKHIENLPEKERKQIVNEFKKMTGSDLSFDVLAKAISEVEVDQEAFDELMADWKAEYTRNTKKEVLCEPNYFEWMKQYLTKNKRLATYHRRKKGITSKEIRNFDLLKVFYDGINEYARANNIASYEFDEVAKGYYFVEHYDTVIGIALYQLDNTVVCEIMESNKLKESNIKAIDFNNVMKYHSEFCRKKTT